MSIGSVKQSGTQVYVYDSNNRLLWRMFGTLVTWDPSSVTINNGTCTYIYDENMHNIGKC